MELKQHCISRTYRSKIIKISSHNNKADEIIWEINLILSNAWLPKPAQQSEALYNASNSAFGGPFLTLLCFLTVKRQGASLLSSPAYIQSDRHNVQHTHHTQTNNNTNTHIRASYLGILTTILLKPLLENGHELTSASEKEHVTRLSETDNRLLIRLKTTTVGPIW